MPTEPVFDYLPPGVLPLINDRIEAEVQRVLDAGQAKADTWEVMLDEQIEEFRSNPSFTARLREVYDSAGVNLISPTVWGIAPGKSFDEGVYRDLARWQARFDAIEWLRPVRSPSDAREIVDAGDVGVVLNVQNLGAFTDGDTAEVGVLYNAGVRVMQLTYNPQNSIGAGCTEPSEAGLSNHGHEVVGRLNELGAVVDLSHCNLETTLEAVGASEAPVAYTHTHCGALHDHERAKSDEELAVLREGDGYVGVLAYPHQFEDPTWDTFFEHVDHAVEAVGVDRVGVGTDWGMTTADVPDVLRPGIASFIKNATDLPQPLSYFVERHEQGLEDFRTYDQRYLIADEFERRGTYTDKEIQGILGGNFLDFWERVEAAA